MRVDNMADNADITQSQAANHNRLTEFRHLSLSVDRVPVPLVDGNSVFRWGSKHLESTNRPIFFLIWCGHNITQAFCFVVLVLRYGFIITARRYGSAVYLLSLRVRPSVRPSHTSSRYCTNTAKRRDHANKAIH